MSRSWMFLFAVDPQDHPAVYRSVDDFMGIFLAQGWRLYSPHFLAGPKNQRNLSAPGWTTDGHE